MRQFGFVKHKVTNAARALPKDFDKLKEEYLAQIRNLVAKHKVPDSLIVNWDQTGIKLMLVAGERK